MPDWLDSLLKVAAIVAVAASALQYQLLKNAREANGDLRNDLADMDRRLQLVEADRKRDEDMIVTLKASETRLGAENEILRSALGAEKIIAEMEARLDGAAMERHRIDEEHAAARHEQLLNVLREIRDRGLT